MSKPIDIDEFIAEKLLGWKWIAYKGIPVRGTPGYPDQCVVRRFASPQLLANEKWAGILDRSGGYTDATGDEPLAYCYCSSQGPELPPMYELALTTVRQLEQLPGWAEIKYQVMAMIDEQCPPPADAKGGAA